MGSSPYLLDFCILILLVCNVNRCKSISCSCKEHERNALLSFQKAHMPKGSSSNRLESWSGDDCCTWEGVGCSKLTCHVVSLNLGVDMDFNEALHPATMNDILTSTLTQLRNLEYLDLRGNLLSRRLDDTPKEFNGKVMLNQLRYLNLSNTGLKGQIPHQLGNLSNLKVLDLSFNYLENPIPHTLSNLSSLQFLSLGDNYFNSTVPSFLGNMRSLQHLDLMGNNFNCVEGGIVSFIEGQCGMKYLDLSHNNLQVSIASRPLNFSRCSKYDLEFLYLQVNQISGGLEWLQSFSALKIVNLDSNSFFGNFPESILSLSLLNSLSLRYNRFIGTVPIGLGRLSSLMYLNLSHNNFTGIIPSDIGELFSLESLNLGSNHFYGHVPSTFGQLSSLAILDLSVNNFNGTIPSTLGQLSSLTSLDLSVNNFNGTIPSTLGQLSSLTYLNLSANNFNGTIPSTLGLLSSLTFLDLSANGLNGVIPSSLFRLSSLYFLDLSKNNLTGMLPDHINHYKPSLSHLNLAYNHLNGTIPISLCNFQHLVIVYMKSNRFSGQIPDCSSRNITVGWEVVDLSLNSLSGLPSFLLDLPRIRLLNLSNNTLEGELPTTISKSLQILDLGENDLYGKIPSWHLSSQMYNSYDLKILRLQSNQLVGMVPVQMCLFDQLQIIDLANNLLTGPIPKCFGNLSGMRSAFEYNEFGAVEQEYTKNLQFLVNLDLSCNNFSGLVPVQLTELQGLRGLNVSHNQLIGKMPSQIGRMKSMVSLDLSDNNLQGSIPQGLANLTFLSSLNLSYNKLHGPIPTGSQLSTFTAASFAGNMNLCGDMLPKKCSTYHEKKPTKMALDEDHNGNDPYEKFWFSSFVMLGTVIGFWGVIGILNVKQGWKYAYLKLGEEVADWIYARWMVKKLK